MIDREDWQAFLSEVETVDQTAKLAFGDKAFVVVTAWPTKFVARVLGLSVSLNFEVTADSASNALDQLWALINQRARINDPAMVAATLGLAT